jgi:hypothetical protein
MICFKYMSFAKYFKITQPIYWPRIICTRIGNSPSKRKPLTWYFSLWPLVQSRAKQWRTSWVIRINRLVRHCFAWLCAHGRCEKYQGKGSCSYYMKHREVTGPDIGPYREMHTIMAEVMHILCMCGKLVEYEEIWNVMLTMRAMTASSMDCIWIRAILRSFL